MSTKLGFVGVTTVLTASDTAPAEGDRFTPDAPETARRKYIMTATADCFVQMNSDATTESAYIIGRLPYQIEMFGDDEMSFITDSSATIYMTQVD